MDKEKVLKMLKYTKETIGMPDKGVELSPNAQTIAIDLAVEKINNASVAASDLKYYLDINEENGVVYIPKFVVEKLIKLLN